MTQPNSSPGAHQTAGKVAAGRSAQQAAGTVAGGPSAQPQQYLTFTLSGETFAIGILAIKEIIEYASMTSVPMMPAYVRGVINLRGAVVPVLDLSVRFGKPASPVTKRTCIVIIEIALGAERQDVGVVVDAVDSVLDIPPDQIEPPPTFGARISTDFIQGMGKVNGRFVVLLEVNSVLAPEEAALLTHAGNPTRES
jgi:purine-binding chemotaxis protein CheW